MTTFDGGAMAIQRQDGTWVTPEDLETMPLPKRWADLLSEFWGATSLHGAIFRQPQGVVFWHCERCRVPTNPSGTRTWDGAATTAKQVGWLCSAVRMWREAGATNAYPLAATRGDPITWMEVESKRRMAEQHA